MKWFKRIAVGLVIVLVVVLAATTVFLGSIVKTSVEKLGPRFAGVPVTLDKARLSPFTGEGRLRQLKIGNPEGFKTPSAFEMGSLSVDMDVQSMFSDRVVINEILIEGPEITYERALKDSNIGKLQKLIAEKTGGAEPEPEEEAPAETKAGKKVQINNFIIRDAKVRLSMTLLGGKALTLPLPTIHLKDIGKEKEGASLAQVISRVFGAIADAILKTVASSGKLIGQGVGAVGGAAVKGVEAVGGAAAQAGDAALKGAAAAGDTAVKAAGAVGATAGEAVSAVGGTAGKAVGAVGSTAGQAAGTAGRAVGEGAKKITGAVGSGAGAVMKGVGGIFGRKKDEDAVEQPAAAKPETGTQPAADL